MISLCIIWLRVDKYEGMRLLTLKCLNDIRWVKMLYDFYIKYWKYCEFQNLDTFKYLSDGFLNYTFSIRALNLNNFFIQAFKNYIILSINKF